MMIEEDDVACRKQSARARKNDADWLLEISTRLIVAPVQVLESQPLIGRITIKVGLISTR